MPRVTERRVFREDGVDLDQTPDLVQQAVEKGWTGIVLKPEVFDLPDPYCIYHDTYHPGWYGVKPDDSFRELKYICDPDGGSNHQRTGGIKHFGK